MPKNIFDEKVTFIQVMSWRRQATIHYLSQCWSRYLSPHGVTRLQWFNYDNKWQRLALVAADILVHYSDVIMSTIASLITSLAVVYSTVYSDADQRKHQSSASLAFVWGIHRDRWIPRTKGQLRGKCFHLMTSSWQCALAPRNRCMFGYQLIFHEQCHADMAVALHHFRQHDHWQVICVRPKNMLTWLHWDIFQEI